MHRDDPAGYGQEHPAIQSAVQLTPSEIAALQLGTQRAWQKALALLLPAKKYIIQAFRSTTALNISDPTACASWMRAQCAVPANESTVIYGGAIGKPGTPGEVTNNATIAGFLVTRGPHALINAPVAVIEGGSMSDPLYRLYRLNTGDPTGACTEGPSAVFSRTWSGGKAAIDCTRGATTLDFEVLL